MYLLGYFVEMTLKKAFFQCLGYGAEEPIRERDLKVAAQLVQAEFDVSEPMEGFHNPVFWSLALVGVRECFGNPLDPEFARELVLRTRRLKGSWAPRMRYAGVSAERDEWVRMREDATWLGAVSAQLSGTGPRS
jgi:hypothetical protein